jgi:hypothetical protein
MENITYMNVATIHCDTNLTGDDLKVLTAEDRRNDKIREMVKNAAKYVICKTAMSVVEFKESEYGKKHTKKEITQKLKKSDNPIVQTGMLMNDFKHAINTRHEVSGLGSTNNLIDHSVLHKNIKTINRINKKNDYKKYNEIIENENIQCDTMIDQLLKESGLHFITDKFRSIGCNYTGCGCNNNCNHNCTSGGNCDKSLDINHICDKHDLIHHLNKNELYSRYNDLFNNKNILKINKLSSELLKENYAYLIQKLNNGSVEKITKSLEKFKHRSSKSHILYRNITDVYLDILKLIFVNVKLRKALYDKPDDNKDSIRKKEIIKNTTEVKKILTDVGKIQNILPRVDFKLDLELKYNKKHELYIERYGYPKNKLFDPERMKEIEKEMHIKIKNDSHKIKKCDDEHSDHENYGCSSDDESKHHHKKKHCHKKKKCNDHKHHDDKHCHDKHHDHKHHDHKHCNTKQWYDDTNFLSPEIIRGIEKKIHPEDFCHSIQSSDHCHSSTSGSDSDNESDSNHS